jgi:flagellar L-ring protein precursor FlgH
MFQKFLGALAPVVLMALLAGVARGQSAGAATPPAGGQNTVSSDLAPASLPIGSLAASAGGSLARATLDARTDSSATSTPMSAASYIAVPETPPKLLHKHDLVTIIVNEQSAYATNGENDLEKTADFDAQIADYIHLNPSQFSLTPEQPSNPLEFKAVASRDLKGTAQVDRTDSLTARITASVVDVKPNGTLVLQATETIRTDDELQMMSLSGTCRVDDITPDNSILSTQLFDLHLDKVHKGQVRDTTKRGLFPRLLDWIDPF